MTLTTAEYNGNTGLVQLVVEGRLFYLTPGQALALLSDIGKALMDSD